MHDKEKIAFIVEDIKMYLQKLEKMKLNSAEDLKDDTKFYASSMILFSILNRTIDLGDEIVKDEKLGYPLEIREIFILLSDNKIISKTLEKRLRDLVISRNKLAHRYGSIKEKDIFNLTKEMKYVKEFVEIILKHVSGK